MEKTERSKFQVQPIFSTPLYKANIERELSKEEQDEIDIIVKEGLEERGEYVENNSTSKDKYLLNGTRKSFLTLQTFFEKHLNEYVSVVMGIDTSKTSCNITQAWLNVNEPQQWHQPHSHQNSIISGVFYINCLRGESVGSDGIVFSKNEYAMFQNIHPTLKQPTAFNCQSVNIEVVTGDLILFPSYLKHSVNRNETIDQVRISLSFNTFLFGVLGDYDKLTELNLKQ